MCKNGNKNGLAYCNLLGATWSNLLELVFTFEVTDLCSHHLLISMVPVISGQLCSEPLIGEVLSRRNLSFVIEMSTGLTRLVIQDILFCCVSTLKGKNVGNGLVGVVSNKLSATCGSMDKGLQFFFSQVVCFLG